jgi:hypothetical protein
MSGTSPDGRLVEVVEITEHPFFVASQFHPEFKSRPDRPAPLFREFVGAALGRARAEHPEAAPAPEVHQIEERPEPAAPQFGERSPSSEESPASRS